jgi:hypothetical protein
MLAGGGTARYPHTADAPPGAARPAYTPDIEGTIMPEPQEIADGPYHLVGTYQLSIRTANPADSARANVTKTFYAYLELYFQGKHDAQIISYCNQNRIECRTTDGSQVERPRRDSADIFAFYEDKGRVACENVVKEMASKWASNTSNNTVFIQGRKNILAVQGKAQRDGYGYDVSFWYDVHDVYVTFHCYPK